MVVPLSVSSTQTTVTTSTGGRSFPNHHHGDEAARRPPPRQQMIRYAMDILAFILLSFLLSIILISWEDLTGRYVLPNRHRTAISLRYPSTSWGTTTVRGMGFGYNERQQLLMDIDVDDDVDTAVSSSSSSFELSESSQNFVDVDPFLQAPTYNEVMLHHRTVTIPQWKQRTTVPMISNAIHSILESLQQLEVLRDLANDYQWEPLRQQLRAPPLSEFSFQSALLRPLSPELNEVVGFDWGSCAWRGGGHACGATADGQEAMDEMDQLLGVLEPHEILFCIDILERSLRDILAVVPWHAPYASESDIVRYQNFPPYVASVQRIETVDDDDDFVALSRIDSEYVKALQELRIDD